MIIILNNNEDLNRQILSKMGNEDKTNVLGVKDIFECQLALMDTECDLLIIDADYEDKSDILCNWIVKNNTFIKHIIIFAKSGISDQNVKILKRGQYKVSVMKIQQFRAGLEKI